MRLKNFLLFSFSAFLFLSVTSQAEARFQKVVLIGVTGNVEVIRNGQTGGEKAVTGTYLKEGDQIKTFDDGKAEIFYEKAGVIYVEPSTLMTIEKAQVSGGVTNTVNFVQNGGIKAKVRQMAAGSAEFKTRTPVAVAAVRGTTYILRVKVNGQTTVYVIEGEVQLQSLLTQLGVTLTEGQSSAIGPDGNVSQVKRYKDEERDIEFIDIDLGTIEGYTPPPPVTSRDVQTTIGDIPPTDEEEDDNGSSSMSVSVKALVFKKG